jgi:predicted transcriptional regulator YheO
MKQPVDSEAFLLSQIEQIADAFHRTYGEAFCEVLIHDFRCPDHSITWIEGHLTHRHVGGATSQIGLQMMAEGDEAQPRINYSIRTVDGKYLKASMIPLRNAEGHVFAALCLKVDMTQLVTLEQYLRQLLLTNEDDSCTSHIHYSDSITNIAQAMIDDVLHQLGMTQPPTDAASRLFLIETLKQRGFFEIRRAVPLLADQLHMSRASIYHYLKGVSSPQVDEDLQGDE